MNAVDHLLCCVQAACWLLVAAALGLVPLFNFFAGLALLHGYLAASGRTSFEICKGAKVRPTWCIEDIFFLAGRE